MRYRSHENYNSYNAQRNVSTSLRRKAIKDYFKKRSKEIIQNPRNFWNTYRPFLHAKRSFKANNILLKEQARIITDKSEIVSIFNNYFINIANHIEVPWCTNYGFNYEEHSSVTAIKEQKESNHTLSFNFSFSHTSCRAIELITG